MLEVRLGRSSRKERSMEEVEDFGASDGIRPWKAGEDLKAVAAKHGSVPTTLDATSGDVDRLAKLGFCVR